MDKGNLISSANLVVEKMANQLTNLIGHRNANIYDEAHNAKPIKLVEYLKERSTSQKRSLRSRMLPEDQGSLILRKKRDEVLRNIDKLVRLLQQLKGSIVERNDISTLVSQDLKIKEITQLTHQCQKMLKNGSLGVGEYDMHFPEYKTISAGAGIQNKLDDGPILDDYARTVDRDMKRSYSPMRSVSEIQKMIDQQIGKPPLDNNRPVNQARPAYTKKMSTQERISSEVEELIESRIITNPSDIIPSKFERNPSAQHLKNSSKGNSFRNNDQDLKESFYQHQPSQPSQSPAPSLPPRPGKKSLTVAIKNSNFKLGMQLS